MALKFGISFWKIAGPTWVPIPMDLEAGAPNFLVIGGQDFFCFWRETFNRRFAIVSIVCAKFYSAMEELNNI